MTEEERREAARKFINEWRGKGDEKQDSQRFWLSLLHDVYGMEDKIPPPRCHVQSIYNPSKLTL